MRLCVGVGALCSSPSPIVYCISTDRRTAEFDTRSSGMSLKVSKNHAMSVSTEPCDKARVVLDRDRARLCVI